jgi:hypothetical protein
VNKQTKLLAWVALGTAGLLFGGLLLRGLVVGPLRTIDDQIRQYEAKLVSLQQARRSLLTTQTQVEAAAAKAFGTGMVATEANLGALLTQRIVQAGLHEAQFTRDPLGHRRLFGAEEVGWAIHGEGPLARVLDLLFVLESDPRLHRVEDLSLSPARGAGNVRVRFSYLTLVLNSPPGAKLLDPPAVANLDSPLRRRYDVISKRDFLRPYIASEQPAPPPVPLTSDQLEVQREQNLTVVSLSSWDGQPEVDLSDAEHHCLLTLRPGDKLLDGQVVLVDYRPLPLPSSSGFLSYSRLIWRVGNEYWAVEAGQTLAQRRRLTPNELPPGLHRESQTTPPP